MLHNQNIKLLSFLLLSLFFAKGTKAQDSTSMSLQQCIDYALSHKSSVLDAELDKKIAQQKVREITGIGLPQINGSAEQQIFLKQPTSFLPDFLSPSVYGILIKEGLVPQSSMPPGGGLFPVKFGTKYNTSAGISASQLLFDGTYFLGLKASKTYVELSQKSIQRTKVDVIAAVSKAYYSVLINKERQQLLNANVTRLERMLYELTAMKTEGFVEQLDVDRLTVATNNLKTQANSVDQLLEISYNLLKFQMGMENTENITLTDKLAAQNFTEDNTENATYSNRPEYALMQTGKMLMEMDVKRNQFGYLPNLVAYGSYSTSSQRNKFGDFDKWYGTAILGFKMGVPIFDGFQKDARIQTAKLTLQKTNNDIKMLEQAIDLDLNSNRILYNNNIKTVAMQKKNLELAQEIVRVTQIKNKEGVGSNLEIINAETSLKEAETNYYSALYDLIISQVDLQKAKGELK